MLASGNTFLNIVQCTLILQGTLRQSQLIKAGRTCLLVCLLELIGVDLESIDHHGEDANLGKDHLVLGTVADESQQEVQDQGQCLGVAGRNTNSIGYIHI